MEIRFKYLVIKVLTRFIYLEILEESEKERETTELYFDIICR